MNEYFIRNVDFETMFTSPVEYHSTNVDVVDTTCFKDIDSGFKGIIEEGGSPASLSLLSVDLRTITRSVSRGVDGREKEEKVQLDYSLACSCLASSIRRGGALYALGIAAIYLASCPISSDYSLR